MLCGFRGLLQKIPSLMSSLCQGFIPNVLEPCCLEISGKLKLQNALVANIYNMKILV